MYVVEQQRENSCSLPDYMPADELNINSSRARFIFYKTIEHRFNVENSLGIEFINHRSNQNKSASFIAIPNR